METNPLRRSGAVAGLRYRLACFGFGVLLGVTAVAQPGTATSAQEETVLATQGEVPEAQEPVPEKGDALSYAVGVASAIIGVVGGILGTIGFFVARASEKKTKHLKAEYLVWQAKDALGGEEGTRTIGNWQTPPRGACELARRSLMKAIALNPKSAAAYRWLAITSRFSEPDRSYQHLERALELDPSDWANYHELGAFLLEDGDFDDAAPAFERALELSDGDYARSAVLTGMSWLQSSLGNDKRGLKLAEEALALRPDNVEAANNLAVALRDAGDVERAADIFRHILETHPDHSPAKANLASCLARLGE